MLTVTAFAAQPKLVTYTTEKPIDRSVSNAYYLYMGDVVKVSTTYYDSARTLYIIYYYWKYGTQSGVIVVDKNNTIIKTKLDPLPPVLNPSRMDQSKDNAANQMFRHPTLVIYGPGDTAAPIKYSSTAPLVSRLRMERGLMLYVCSSDIASKAKLSNGRYQYLIKRPTNGSFAKITADAAGQVYAETYTNVTETSWSNKKFGFYGENAGISKYVLGSYLFPFAIPASELDKLGFK